MQHRSIALACAAGLVSTPALPASAEPFTPGAPGIGDAYFPLDGNGGYDVEHYLLQVRYEPGSDQLNGVATLSARATQNLSRFNLDFDGLDLRAVEVDGCAATWARADGELGITPERGLRDGAPFEVVVRYAGRGCPRVVARARHLRLHPHGAGRASVMPKASRRFVRYWSRSRRVERAAPPEGLSRC